MKYLIRLSIPLFGILLMTSCDMDFLETIPKDRIAETNVFLDPALTQASINGIYQSIQIQYYQIYEGLLL